MRRVYEKDPSDETLFVGDVYIKEPGKYQFKFIVDDTNWTTNQCNNSEIDEMGNHILEIRPDEFKDNVKMCHNNLTFARKTFNNFSNKMAKLYQDNFTTLHDN